MKYSLPHLTFTATPGIHCHTRHSLPCQAFIAIIGIHFKQDAITTHSKSSFHSAALESEMLQKMSCFHQELKKKSEMETYVLEKSFATAYFLMKEFIANLILIANFSHY